MKNSNIYKMFTVLAAGFACLATPLAAQLTPIPDHFTTWTGSANADWFNPANWSTGVVPEGADAAVRLLGDSRIPNKHIYANYTGTGDKTIQLYSIQSGASKVYTVEFSGNCVKDADDNVIAENWLILNPVGKGFTFNGIIGDSMGLSYDITYAQSTGNDSNRLASYYVLNSYTKLTLDGSSAGIRVAESGLTSGVFTLKGNAQMDISNAGTRNFITTTGTYGAPRTARIQIGGLQTDPGTYIYVGGQSVNLNSKMAAGEVSVMGGVFEGNNSGNAECYIYGWKTIMSGIVNFTGDGRAKFVISSNAQYIVNGVHNGNISINSGCAAGGSGIINGSISVGSGGMFTPGERGTASDNPLTVNASSFTLNGNLGIDMVTNEIYDRLIVNLASSGTMFINGRNVTSIDPDTGAEVVTEGNANLIVGMASTFPRKPGEYDVMSVNLLKTGTVSAVIAGDFGKNVSFPVSMSFTGTTEWRSTFTDIDGVERETRHLWIIFNQGRFSLDDGRYTEQMLHGRHLEVANIVDDLYLEGYHHGNAAVRDTYEPLFDQLNRQPSITLYRSLLDQLTPTTFQAWFPSAIVRTNSLVQSLEDRMYQDAAFGRKKGSFQMFLDGYRQEASRGKDEQAAYSNYNTFGTVLGCDHTYGEKFTAGVFLNYDYTEYDIDTIGGTAHANSYTAGFKARYNIGNFQANVTGFFGTDSYKTKRSVAMTGLGQWADSDTDGTRLGAALSLSYKLNFAWFEITPVAGIQMLDWKADGFQERNGGEANIRVCDQSETSLQGKLGVRVARTFKFRNGSGAIRPFFHYSALREFESDPRSIDADILGSNRIRTEVPGINANGWRMDMGVDWTATRKLRIELRYNSEYRSAANENVGIRGAVNYTF